MDGKTIELEAGTYVLVLPDGLRLPSSTGGFGTPGFTVTFQHGEGGSADVAFLTVGEGKGSR